MFSSLKKYVFLMGLGLALMANLAHARTFTFALPIPAESHYGAAANAFKSTLERLSNHRHTVSIKPNGMLGSEREVLEGLQIGSVDFAISSTGPVGGFVPETYVLDLPFLFHDYAHARQVMQGNVGQQLLSAFTAHDIQALGWGENGFRHLTNSRKPVHHPEDLKGLKIRTQENDIHIQSFKALNGAPTPMAWHEVFTALQQGTIDGQENPMAVFVSTGIWEVQKYATLSGHFYSPAVIMMSKQHWDRLSAEEQSWVEQATAAAIEANYAFVDQNEAEGIAQLKAHGMEVVETIDKAAFASAVQPVYDAFIKKYGTTLLAPIQAQQP